MAYDGIAKVQHYVPQFLLKNFGTGKKDKLHVFDKLTGKSFATNARNVAAESRFYDFQLMGQDYSVETALSKMEGEAKPLIKSILDADSLADLSCDRRAKLSVFMAVQLTRGKWCREKILELSRVLNDLKGKSGEEMDDSRITEDIQVPDANELAILTARAISAAHVLAPFFADKVWVLGTTDSKNPFQLGDNPIGLQNSIDMGPYGNIGLALQGIEIYFPLSPQRVLAMLCPSHERMFRAAAMRDGPTSVANEILTAIETGNPLTYRPEQVLNFNSIQVRHAERFVFSSTDDFSLVRRMIADDERYRKGPRFTVN